jgi:hypothetical protein
VLVKLNRIKLKIRNSNQHRTTILRLRDDYPKSLSARTPSS